MFYIEKRLFTVKCSFGLHRTSTRTYNKNDLSTNFV